MTCDLSIQQRKREENIRRREEEQRRKDEEMKLRLEGQKRQREEEEQRRRQQEVERVHNEKRKVGRTHQIAVKVMVILYIFSLVCNSTYMYVSTEITPLLNTVFLIG